MPIISLTTNYVTLGLSLAEVFVSVALGVVNRDRYLGNTRGLSCGSNSLLGWKYQVIK
jgi:hypothetical protein